VTEVRARGLYVEWGRPENVSGPNHVFTRSYASGRVLGSQRSRAEGGRVRCHGDVYDTRAVKMYQKISKNVKSSEHPRAATAAKERWGCPRAGGLSALGDPSQAQGRNQGFLELRHGQGEHAVIDPGLELRVIEVVAEAQPQTIVALRSLEVEGLPVHAHKTGLVRGDD